MQLLELSNILKENTYPGRGIVIGRSEDGKRAIIAYFIMGRSENSRNRVFTEREGGIITEAYDPSKIEDPSLIIYAPVRVLANTTIVTNGDQTDTVYNFIMAGKTFEEALHTRTFEPDAPNFTPRVSGIVDLRDGDFSYKMSILKSCGGNPESVERFFFEYLQPVAGQGRFIHTYKCDGNPIPSFEGEPETVAIHGDIEAFTTSLWESLNPDNKVSLFVRTIALDSGETETRIINKHC
ncbi:MAG: IMP cyclohydrolase [Candidatus Fimivivens sp.]|nr:IMP cyclohydrolase [Candidatus Fimivivens sp.]